MKILFRTLWLLFMITPAFCQANGPSFVKSDPSLANEALTSPGAERETGVSTPQTDSAATPVPELPRRVVSDLQTRPRAESVLLPTATVLRLKLTREVSTLTARPGQAIETTLSQPVVVSGREVLPAGTTVECQVQATRNPRRIAGKPMLMMKARRARMSDGSEIFFTASMIDTGNPHHLDVDQEGRLRGANHNRMDDIELVAGAGTGAVAGMVIAGVPGLVVGTASGALVATGHAMTKHRHLTLPAGTELIFELDAPATSTRTQDGLN